MILSYVDILGDGNRHTIQATITTAHPSSSYNQPVVVLEDGMPLDIESWLLMGYQVVQVTPDELELLKQWIGTAASLFPIPVSVAAATLGRIKSPRKARASAENGKRGGRPKRSSKRRTE